MVTDKFIDDRRKEILKVLKMVGIESVNFYSSEDSSTVYGTYIFTIYGEDYSVTLTELFEKMSLIDLKRLNKRLNEEIKKREEGE